MNILGTLSTLGLTQHEVLQNFPKSLQVGINGAKNTKWGVVH